MNLKVDTAAIHPAMLKTSRFSGQEFYKLSAEAVNKHMHVLTPQGEIKIGVDAFAYIWSLLPKYKFAAVLIKLPIINSIAKIGYWAFAKVRPLLPKKRRS